MSASDAMGEQFKGLADLQKAGHVTDEWSTWQQGKCGTYAVALQQEHPHLKFGVLGTTEKGGGDASAGWTPSHFFAHDETHAYDSAGKHPLPYRGVRNQADYHELGHDAEDWGMPDEEGSGPKELQAAREHIRRHGIGPRR